ncbi:MAG: hypothetical protein HY293_19785 [Planctomycetes bacterium]|nr:hypothetical protein [Planctomycetota bacterium]
MNPGSTRSRKWIAGVFLSMLGIVLGLQLWIRSVESRKWEEMDRAARALREEAHARPAARAALRGGSEEGNAWELYDHAESLIKSRGSIAPIRDYIVRPGSGYKSRAEESLKVYEEALADLRRAARRLSARRRVNWEEESPWSPGRLLAWVARCKARFLTESGQARDAAGILLDVLQLGQDMVRDGEIYGAWVGFSVHGEALEDLKGLVLSGTLSRDDLKEIDRELEILDGSFPVFGDVVLNSAMRIGFQILRAGTLDRFLEEMEFKNQPRPRSWRNAFSDRLMMVDVFERELSDARRSAAGDLRPWGEARSLTAAIDLDRAAFGSPLFKAIFDKGPLMPYQLAFREHRARLRLLRMAVRHGATGEVPVLPDPLGTELRFSQHGDRWLYWSAGGNGVDDGGAGGWKGDGKDIVLDVKQ